MANYTLPKLPYDYDALEPYIDSTTLEIHYTKHHQSYVDGLNKAVNAIADARKEDDYSRIKYLKRELAFHYSGHLLHTIYWNCMGPKDKNKIKPTDELLSAINESFGSYSNFIEEFKTTAKAVEGSGWAVLAYIENELAILTIEKHQNLTIMGAVPILVCDVWEHAYYLKYKNKRADYIDNFFNVIDWAYVEQRYSNMI